MNEKRPNILIFMTDHQRADTVLPGHPAIMPNVERLGKEGVTFTQAYCPMAHCCPSRATFFSGLYPSRHGVWNNVINDHALSLGLQPGVRLFSEDLRDAGYNLAYTGKWHVSAVESPQDRGWKEYEVSATGSRSNRRTWDKIKEIAAQPEPTERKPGYIHKKGYETDVLYAVNNSGSLHDEKAVGDALEAIREFGKDSKPWAVYVGAIMPHAPYKVPQKYLDMYKLENIPLPASYHDNLRDKPNYYRKLREMRFDQLSELEVRDAIRHFWAMCTYLDELFGKLLDAVEEIGQRENTLVLYCSDHGDYLGDHGLFHKGVPSFLSAYRVPAVIRWPAGIKNPGRTVDELVSLADFAPTFTELGGFTPDSSLTGQSLVPFLLDRKVEGWRDTMFTQCNGVENYFTQRMAFDKNFKYVYNGFDFDELYDLKNDPDEMVNLQACPEYDEVKRQLVKKMWQFAYREKDNLGTAGGYITVSTAAWGPSEAFRD